MNDIATIGEGEDLIAHIARTTQSPALRIMLDDKLFEKAKAIAHYMSSAKGFVPPHLEGNTHACFAVVMISISVKMDPYSVARNLYQTPNGQVGFYGKLVQAIVENSGKLDPAYGGMKPEYYGDWSKVQGQFRMKTVEKTGRNGKYNVTFPEGTWKPDDEEGLGVIVRAKIRGETDPREMEFDLKQAFPRNSTLWATDPKTQLWYAAVRRFADSRMPGLLLGLPDEGAPEYGGQIIDVTPQPAESRPTRASVQAKKAAAPVADAGEVEDIPEHLRRTKTAQQPAQQAEPGPQPEPEAGGEAEDGNAGDGDEPEAFEIVDEAGEIRQYEHPGEAMSEYLGRLKRIAKPGAIQIVRGFFESNHETISTILDRDLVDDGRAIVMEAQKAAVAAAQPPEKPQAGQQQAAAGPQGGEEPPPPTSADDYGAGGGRQQGAGQQASDADWLVPYNPNAKNSTGMVSYMTALREKLGACQHKGHVAIFNRANRANMVAATDKYRLAQMRDLLAEVDERLRG